MGNKKIITTLKLEPSTLEKVDEIAELNYMNRSETIRKMLELFVGFHEKEQSLRFLQYTQKISVDLPTMAASTPPARAEDVPPLPPVAA